MTHFKVHILGNGNAAQKHIAAYKQLPEKFTITDSYVDADVIDICTPNYLHFSQAITAAEMGKMVIVEKPPCGSLLELEVLCHYPTVFVMFQHPFEEIDSELRMYKRGPSYFNGWRGDLEKTLGGVLTTHAIHDIYNVCREQEIAVASCSAIHPLTGAAFQLGDIQGNNILVCTYLSDYGDDNALHEDGSGYINWLKDFPCDEYRISHPDIQHTMEVLTALYFAVTQDGEVEVDTVRDPSHPYFQGWIQPILQHQRNMESSQRISV